MASLLPFLRSAGPSLPLIPSSAVAGGTYIVTGANTGLGFECAKHLVALGAGRTILAVRSTPKGEAALAAIRAETQRSDAGEVWDLDLASLASVEAFSKRINTLDRLDGLIENASVALDRFTITDGLETTLLVNVAGTTLLAARAMPKLRETAARFGVQPHLSVVSSDTEFMMEGALDGVEGNLFEALSQEPQTLTGHGYRRYPLSKLLQIHAARQLAALCPVSETGVVVNVLSPGLCTTELARNMPYLGQLLIAWARLLAGRTAEEGSRNLLHAVTAGEQSHGRYMADCRVKEMPAWVTDEAAQERVWADLVEVLGKRGHRVDVSK